MTNLGLRHLPVVHSEFLRQKQTIFHQQNSAHHNICILRSLFAFRIANPVQAVLYTAVLFDMAFAGIGPLLVYLFAITQGSMFEESESLLYVLIVHLIVDYFLYWEIVNGQYPGYVQTGLFH